MFPYLQEPLHAGECKEMFEQATRLKLRFSSVRGLIGVEDLWDLSLTNLDSIAVDLHKMLQDTSVSFVRPVTTENTRLQLAFDVVKHVIDTKIVERDTTLVAHERAKKKQQLLEILSRKQNAELEGKTPEELSAMINSL